MIPELANLTALAPKAKAEAKKFGVTSFRPIRLILRFK